MFFLKNAGLTLAMLSFAGAANAGPLFTRSETISVETYTAATAQVLTGEKGSKVTIAGFARFPKQQGKQPIVVLMHGAGGQGGADGVSDLWSQYLNDAGIATFNLDSYAGRGLNTMQEAASMPAITRVIDAYAALAVLAKHPLVDPGKIVVMGFSHGSQAAMYSNLERFQKLYAGGLKFAAHISFYGICGTKLKDDEATLSPMLLVHGQADDWVPMQPCQEYAGRLQKANQKITLKIYQNAHHAFDAKVLGKVIRNEGAISIVACRWAEKDQGMVVNVESGKPPSSDESCRTKGVSFGYDEAATNSAKTDVLAFLKSEVLK